MYQLQKQVLQLYQLRRYTCINNYKLNDSHQNDKKFQNKIITFYQYQIIHDLHWLSYLNIIKIKNMSQMSIIRSQRNCKYCFNISEHYCCHWTQIHALRQALQNWMDAWKSIYPNNKLTVKFEENKIQKISFFYLIIDGVKNLQNYIKYDQQQKTLKMVNQGSFLRQNMLMGASTNKNPLISLGQFGQGMKLYFLILLKYGYILHIESGGYVYAPYFEKSQFQQYQSRVLYVNIKPRDNFIKNTQLVIKRVNKTKFDQFRHISLMLVDDYQIIEYPGRGLIVSGKQYLNSNLFKRNILVGLRYKLDSKYSFNFDKISLGRERDSINDPGQLRQLSSQLYADILADYQKWQQKPQFIDQMPKILAQVIRLIEKNSFDVYHISQKITAPAADRIYREFLRKRNVAQLYPVNSSADQKIIDDNLKLYGLDKSFYPSQFVGWIMNGVIRKSSKFQSINTKINKQILVGRQMTDIQRNQFNNVKNSIASTINIIPNLNNLNFKVHEIQGIHLFKKDNTICININKMRQNTAIFTLKLVQILVKDV